MLLAASVLLTAAAAFAWFARNEMRRSEQNKFIIQARSVAEIACAVTSKMIAADKNGFDSTSEKLYSKSSGIKIKVGEFGVIVAVEPLDDKIPLSGIFLPDGVTVRNEYKKAWEKVWELAGAPELAPAVLDFMDAGSVQQLGGHERKESINRTVSDLTELKALPEIDNALLWGDKEHPGGIGAYLTVWGGEKINFNTAAPEVISMLDDSISLARAQRLAAYRADVPLKELADIKKIPGFPAATVTKLAGIIGFESVFFRLSLEVAGKNGKTRNYRVILKRGGTSCVIVRWEE